MIDTIERERLEIMSQLIGDIRRRLVNLTLEQFAEDRDERDLTAYRLAAIGENGGKLSVALRASYPDVPWREMIGLRNVVSHEYRIVAPRQLWDAVRDLDKIMSMCATELA